MKVVAKLLPATFVLLLSQEVGAQIYIGIDYLQGKSRVSQTIENVKIELDKVDYTAWNIDVGYKFNQKHALELRFGQGQGSDEKEDPALDDLATVEPSNHVGVYWRMDWNLIAGLDVYGLVGIAHMRSKIITDLDSSAVTATGVSYGVGFEYTFADQLGISSEWWRMQQDSNLRTDVLSLGLNYYF